MRLCSECVQRQLSAFILLRHHRTCRNLGGVVDCKDQKSLVAARLAEIYEWMTLLIINASGSMIAGTYPVQRLLTGVSGRQDVRYVILQALRLNHHVRVTDGRARAVKMSQDHVIVSSSRVGVHMHCTSMITFPPVRVWCIFGGISGIVGIITDTHVHISHRDVTPS
jgi:hypothetical protein